MITYVEFKIPGKCAWTMRYRDGDHASRDMQLWSKLGIQSVSWKASR
jgi:hypothetical protein